MNSTNMDLLITNAHVLDAFSGMDGMYSLAIKRGKIAGIYPIGAILPASNDVLDLQGTYLSAGWIDLHAHVAPNRAVIGIDADTIGIRQGVTTVVDAGSCGCKTFDDFEKNIINKSKTRVLSWLNIANVGLYNGSSELADLDNIDEDDIARLISQKPAIRGIKVRMSHSVVQNTGTGGLLAAKKLSHKLQIPVFVHVGNQPPRLADILNLLDQGDVVTHIFHGKPGGCLDSREDILPELQNAINRGIYLDLGHGTESCSFSRFKQAREKGLCIDTISTDLYSQNYSGPVYSLAHTMEKCMLMGMSLPEVLAAVTLKPSLVLRVPDIGKIKVGAEGDLTYFTIDDTEQVYSDSEGNKLMGKKQFHIYGVVRQGEIIVNDK
ncbi:amidohydrolase/deacetylase family metallohydrolase [Pectinatus frisingensis]|uniref:amidohydrolase/deacetylase family metallohydrolase n=1 Tax=Pectinatus frisingensis TaxID=865 RepID=UPI0018C64B1B|nr:amidohydrolase/deacetylase family metallohydrolase [Pectinatus frisingensis]